MRYRRLGHSGLVVSTVGLGCRHLGGLDRPSADRLVRSAIDGGVTLFDTADVYGSGQSEEALGRALMGSRDDVVVATKFRWRTADGPHGRGASRLYVRKAVEASLRRLGTDRIDLYQLHAPDPATPIDETVDELNRLTESGKILYFGNSNFGAWQLVDAFWRAKALGGRAFVSTQAPYGLLDRRAEGELLPAVRHLGMGFLACMVLARGALLRDSSDASGDLLLRYGLGELVVAEARAVLREVAEDVGLSPVELAICAVLEQPGVSSALIGSVNVDHLSECLGASDVLVPPEAMRRLKDLIPRGTTTQHNSTT